MPIEWSEIVNFYRAMRASTVMDPEYQRGASAVADVAEYIAMTWLCEGLFAYTSHYALCVHQTNQNPLDARPVLRMEPLRISDKVEFRFVDTHKKSNQWSRIVPPEETVPRFIHTLTQLRWISNAALATLPNLNSVTSK